jgi:hypothetical protein
MYHRRPIEGRPAVVEERVLVPNTAAWRYEASGGDQGTAWREPGYGDGK